MPRLRWVIVATLGLLFFFIAGTAYFFELRRIFHLKFAVAERSAKLEQKERIVREYKEKIEFYKTREGIAHLARDQYNLAFPGERVFMIVDVSSDRTLADIHR